MSSLKTKQFRLTWLISALTVMLFAELFFVLDFVDDLYLFDFYLVNPIYHTKLENLSSFALAIAIFFTFYEIKLVLKEQKDVKTSLEVAAGHLSDVINSQFAQWQFSASESQIALLLMKGLSLQEIADARGAKIGTVKSQCSSIYRKSELANRSELVSFFMEDLLVANDVK
jgi:DNA-binding CsgD family transcriptional regulator